MSREIKAAELAGLVGGEIKGSPDIVLKGVAALNDATENDISFLANRKYQSQIADTGAGAIIVGKDFDGDPEGKTVILCDDPNVAFSKAVEIFSPEPVKYPAGIHESAVVHESVKLGEGSSVCANAVVEEGVEIGRNTVIGAGVYLGHFTKIGDDCLIYPNVTVRERCTLGSRIIIHSGTVIGSDGYGFAPGPQGIIKLPQVGVVQIDDDVEIGANCAIDRARFGKTWLKRGVKLDNMVHVAHNVEVGEFSMLIGQSGVAGSAKIGRGVIVAAQAGINGHITIGDGVRVAGTSGVLKDVPPGKQVLGTPAEFPKEFMERFSLPRKFRKLSDRIKALEKKLGD